MTFQNNINVRETFCEVAINPKLYSLEIVHSASYIMLDDCYIVIDGDPEKEILVRIKPKEKGKKLEDLGLEFSNNLITFKEYDNNFKNNKEIRDLIMQRALVTNDPSLLYNLNDDIFSETEEDPEDIAVPWEDKYNKK